MAREYAFPLDPFQATSIACIEADESVLVAAHTSAGKTVIAEYAIAKSLRDNQRVVYTSPLKALSNQKFRELSEAFGPGEVGLMTGDVTLNPNAGCLVMTTEILRSMLYRGSDVAREVAWIVFDEIHYLRDKERGVVWEETIVLVPDRVRFVFLSATLPNAEEFAGWIANTHSQPCHLVSTDYRPTPLQHYLFPAGAEGLYMVVDERAKFKPDNFQKAIAELNAPDPTNEALLKRERARRGDEDILRVVELIIDRKFDPCIVFAFSKRECESLAVKLTNLDLTDEDEKGLIERIYWNAMDCLSPEDKGLPQIRQLLPFLKQGIGVHHSGLLPILKEVVEILFQEGLLKCLFATETFSTGLNMPAKTVVFVRPRKFDGGGFRWLSSGEYIQMSGRAGRRGLDDRGIVILMLDSKMEPAVARQMVQGSADPLTSAFHLSFNMILSLLRTEGGDPERLMKASYRQYQMERALPGLAQKAAELKALSNFCIDGEEEAEARVDALAKAAHLRAKRRTLMHAPALICPYLQPGRLVKVSARDPLVLEEYLARKAKEHTIAHDEGDDGVSAEAARLSDELLETGGGVWGAVERFKKVSLKRGSVGIIVDVLVGLDPTSSGIGVGGGGGGGDASAVLCSAMQADAVPKVVSFDLSRIEDLSKVRMRLPKNLKTPSARKQLLSAVREVEKRFVNGGVPLLDPERDMQVADAGFREATEALRSLGDPLHGLDAHDASIRGPIELICKKRLYRAMALAASREEEEATALVGLEELKARRRLLRKMGYVDSNGVVQRKGHIAAGISSGDEIVITELLVNGTFKNLPNDQTVAMLSCFVHTEKASSAMDSKSTALLEEHFHLFAKLREQVQKVASNAKDARLNVDTDKYLESFSPQLMEAAAAWTRGASFGDILKISKVFEGSLVRTIRRVDELLQQLIAACQSIGEVEQAEHFEECSNQVKRDVVFAASLYI